MTPTMFQVHLTVLVPLIVSALVIGHKYFHKQEMDPLEAMTEWYKVMAAMFLLIVGMSLGRFIMAFTDAVFLAAGVKHG